MLQYHILNLFTNCDSSLLTDITKSLTSIYNSNSTKISLKKGYGVQRLGRMHLGKWTCPCVISLKKKKKKVESAMKIHKS
ncbi:hypothetical protein RchiOBHm_Chr1g0326281 [Rosa chinensis]|uniref:Uncharacterized protein n=1 Tax=Rosa chinensis TaxID=74649 RepID=A0A2P6SAA0_ROSCH|nr:hypothetical protein RchiOBHm_Chr1g0326281 [Rosa chinensis]